MEQIEGLFGTSSPSKIRQDYLNQFLVSPAQMGQQGLLQQVVSLMSNAGANIGAQGSRMLGGKLAGEQEALAIQKVMDETKGETDPIKRLRAASSQLSSLGMHKAAQKAAEQADVYEVRALTMQEKKAAIERTQAQTAKDAADATAKTAKITSRTATLAKRFPELEDSEISAIAADDASFRAYIKPPKDYTPSDYAKLLIEGGGDPASDEFKNKIAAWSEARLKAEQTKNKADINAVAVQQDQVELDRDKFRAEGDRRKQAEANTKARLKQLTSASHVKMITNRIDTAVGLISKDTVGWRALILKDLPETKARALKNKLDVIKGNIGFDRLQQMRDASPTGGALGQVAVQELYALQNSIDSLDQLQTGEELEQALNNIKAQYESYVKNQRASMEANEPLLGTPESDAILAELQARTNTPTAPAAAPTAPAAASGVIIRNWK